MAATRAWMFGLALLVAVPPLAAGDWLQWGGGPARTAVLDDTGPALNEVAYTIDLPGTRPWSAVPLVQDGQAFVLTSSRQFTPAILYEPEGAMNAIVVVDLETGVSVVHELGHESIDVVGDGRLLYVVRRGGVDAFDPATGSVAPLWEFPPSPYPFDYLGTICGNPAVLDQVLYVSCAELGRTAAGALGPLPNGEVVSHHFAAAIEIPSGRESWRWISDNGDALRRAAPVAGNVSAPGHFSFPLQMSVVGPHVLVQGLELADEGGPCEVSIWSFDAVTGRWEWVWKTTFEASDVPESPQQPGVPAAGPDNVVLAVCWPEVLGVPTGSDNLLYWLTDRYLVTVNAATGQEAAPRVAIGTQDAYHGVGVGGGMAVTERLVFADSQQTLTKFDRLTLEPLATLTLAGAEEEYWGLTPPLLADGVLYARSIVGLDRAEGSAIPVSAGTAFYAISAADLSILWRHVVPPAPGAGVTARHSYSVAEGKLLIQNVEGTLTVLGPTAASLSADADLSDLYPAVGKALRADLTESGAGSFGPPTSFAADWGDGQQTEWQPDPVLEHRYAERCDCTAVLWVSNEAGQTAAKTVVFHVGADPPTLLEKSFSRENQDVSFFVLGLAITATGALLGLVRLRRNRRRLAREMAAIEALHRQTRDRPAECQAALAERAARARALVVDGRLTEAQGAVLLSHIDELRRGLRMSAIDERLAFLPMGMVERLRSMLADGQVSAWERQHFLRALEEDGILTPGQKAKVRALVDGWFGADAHT